MTTLLSPPECSRDSDISSARFRTLFRSDKPNLTSFFATRPNDTDAIISNEWWHVLFVCVPSKLASLAHFSAEIQFDAFIIVFFLFKACQARDRERLENEIIEIDFVTRDVRWWIMMLHQHYANTNNCLSFPIKKAFKTHVLAKNNKFRLEFLRKQLEVAVLSLPRIIRRFTQKGRRKTLSKAFRCLCVAFADHCLIIRLQRTIMAL